MGVCGQGALPLCPLTTNYRGRELCTKSPIGHEKLWLQEERHPTSWVRRPLLVQGHLVVSDIHAARARLVERGVEVSEVEEHDRGVSYAYFSDPDGNSWAVQQLPY